MNIGTNISLLDNKITDLAEGTNPKDAINLSQLNEAIDGHNHKLLNIISNFTNQTQVNSSDYYVSINNLEDNCFYFIRVYAKGNYFWQMGDDIIPKLYVGNVIEGRVEWHEIDRDINQSQLLFSFYDCIQGNIMSCIRFYNQIHYFTLNGSYILAPVEENRIIIRLQVQSMQNSFFIEELYSQILKLKV